MNMPKLFAWASFPLLLGCSSMFHQIQEAPENEIAFPTDSNWVAYIGHATVLIHLDNVNIITDPVFSDRIGWFAKRYIKPGIAFEKLPEIDMILISHEHWDHLDKPTLRRFPRDIPVIISAGLGDRIRKLGFKDVREISWWEATAIGNIKITATPAQHIASRISSYVIEGSKTVFFAGDTGLSDEFREIGSRFDIDLALLPIGDYHPRLSFIPGFKKMTRGRHLAPGDVPAALEMLRTRLVAPIHWGTFKISGTGLDEPLIWLRKLVSDSSLEKKVIILGHGETRSF